jgi:hypothetical protein
MLTKEEKDKMWRLFNPPFSLSVAVIARRFKTGYQSAWAATAGRKREEDAKKTNME